MYHGDFVLGDTFDIKFTTRRFTTGAPHTLAGVPVISAYPGNSTTQLTAGITLTVDFDSATGLNNVRVVASSGNGYATATNYALVITTGSVDSVSVVGEVVATFSIENRILNAAKIAADAITAAKIAAGAIDEATFAADTAKYFAKVWLIDDNSGTTDRYVTVWYKNGEPIVSGITSPTIQVIKAADGTDLVASTAMTQIGALGLYRKDEATNRIVNGVAYIIKVQATIDSGTRTWYQPIGNHS